MNSKENKQSATVAIIKALIPYTQNNLQLVFHPGEFFDRLERETSYPRRTLVQSYARAKKSDLIRGDETPAVTLKGRIAVQPYIAKSLEGGQVMVIFDVPEDFGEQRRRLRQYLRRLEFSQVQRSVWVSDTDHVAIMRDIVRDLGLSDWVLIYEAVRIES